MLWSNDAPYDTSGRENLGPTLSTQVQTKVRRARSPRFGTLSWYPFLGPGHPQSH
jgi:hypothetical protein